MGTTISSLIAPVRPLCFIPPQLVDLRRIHGVCPLAGQIELYTHHPFFPTLVSNLNRLGIRTCAVYLLESQFIEDKYKFFSGVLSAMSAMVNLEIPCINVMSKMDLVSGKSEDPARGRNGIRRRRNVARYLEPDPHLLMSADGEPAGNNPRFHSLNQAIVQLIEDHPLVSFLPLDLTSTESLETVVSHVDFIMQYGEDEEPKEPHDLDEGDFADME